MIEALIGREFDSVWLDYAKFGFYVFDWDFKDRYVKRVSPIKEIQSTLKTKLLTIDGLPLFQANFAEQDSIDTKIKDLPLFV